MSRAADAIPRIAAAAARLAARGLRVFPVRSMGKSPWYEGWQQAATNDPESAATQFSRTPRANIGIATGPASNCWVLDIDPNKGGLESLDALEMDYGFLRSHASWIAETPSGGLHLFFEWPTDGREIRSRTNVLGKFGYPGIDTRGIGGLAVAPPSRRRDGDYAWQIGQGPDDGDPLVPAPDWLIDLLARKPATGECTPLPDAREFTEPELRTLQAALRCFTALADDYHDWIRIGFALHGAIAGDAAFELWCEWSACSSKFDLDEARAKWESFNRTNYRGRRAGLGTVFYLAQRHGTPEQLAALERLRRVSTEHEIPRAPEPPPPTRSPVRTIEEGHTSSVDALAPFPGTSIVLAGSPGIGKSQAAHERLIDLARENRQTVALFVPTRANVDEVAKRLQRASNKMTFGLTTVVTFKGRTADPESEWHCQAIDQSHQNVRHGYNACDGCPFLSDCSSQRGNYLHTRAARLREARRARKGAVIAATAELRHSLWGELRRTTPLVLDDVGPTMGLVREIEIERLLLSDELLNVDKYRRGLGQPTPSDTEIRKGLTESQRISLAAAIFDHLARALLDDERGDYAFVDAVAGLPESWREWLAAATIQTLGQTFPWEGMRGSTLRPAFAHHLLEAARNVLEGYGATRRLALRKESDGHRTPVVRMHLADRQLIDRARNGNVAWLQVGPAPTPVTHSVKAQQEIIVAEPDVRIVRAHHPRTNFGGRRINGQPNLADLLTRGLVRTLWANWDERVGCIVQKPDALDLGFEDLRVGYYGASHASTNRFDDCEVLVVRRGMPPFDEIAFEAVTLASALGLPRPEVRYGRDGLARERRGDTVTHVPRDPLAREMLRFHEAHNVLNAIGRCRPVTNPGRLVILLEGVPADYLGTVEEMPLADLCQSLNLPIDWIADAERQNGLGPRRFAHYCERVQAVATARREDPDGSVRELAEATGISRAAVGRQLDGQNVSDILKGSFTEVRDVLSTADFARVRQTLGPGLAAAIAERTDVSARTIRRRLADVVEVLTDPDKPPPADPRRRKSLREVLRVLAELVDEPLALCPRADGAGREGRGENQGGCGPGRRSG